MNTFLKDKVVAFEFKNASDETVANYFDDILESSGSIPTTENQL